MSNSSKKTPWHLRFAPGAILRPIGRLASQAVSLGVSLVQTVRQRLNQWNWRKKTALVTALAITAAGVFYQNRAHAAAFTWPTAIAASVGTDFLVSVFASYASSSAINSKIKKTANANPDGWLYRNREYYERKFSYSDNGSTKTEVRRITAEAMAAQDKTYDTEGTDTMASPSDLDADEVLDEVSDNTNLRFGITETYQVLEGGEPLYTWTRYTPRSRNLVKWTIAWGGYVKKPTAAEIQEELDEWRAYWNATFQDGDAPGRRPARLLGRLTLGPKVSRTFKRFTCDKKIKLWSDFEFNRVPGDTSAGPNELQQPGQRSTYVTEFSYYAREAGYDGGIVTKIPQNEEKRFEYPEPRSYNNHSYLPQQLDSIIWGNYKIIGTPVWSGEATRFFKHKKIKNWCTFCNRKHNAFWRVITGRDLCSTMWRTRHEIPVYQNESVVKP